MDVIIVSKTRMSNASCVGGVLANGRFVRLLDKYGYNQDINTPLNIGDVWTIDFSELKEKKPPHIEDILIKHMTFKFSFETHKKMIKYLTEKLNVKIWKGGPNVLFDGKLYWTNGGSGYISERGGIPDNSVGFWMPDKTLIRNDYERKVRYTYQQPTPFGIVNRNITFVGYQEPVNRIPAGTLLRVSLARWWAPNDEVEKRCYLQLSGWYDLPASKPPMDNDIDIDLPF